MLQRRRALPLPAWEVERATRARWRSCWISDDSEEEDAAADDVREETADAAADEDAAGLRSALEEGLTALPAAALFADGAVWLVFTVASGARCLEDMVARKGGRQGAAQVDLASCWRRTRSNK